MGSKTGREKKPCPVSTCGCKVCHIPRHLQKVHGWSREDSRTASVRFGLRKQYTKKEKGTVCSEDKTGGPKKKDYHHPRCCPITGCKSLVKRMGPHLKNVHHLDPNSQQFKDALLEAKDLEKKTHIGSDHETLVDFQSGALKEPSKPLSSCTDVLVVEVDSQSDYGCEDNETLAEMPQTTGDGALAKFRTWLESADGGKLDNKTSTQHEKQVSKLLSVIDEKKELSSLFNHLLINDKFLEGHAKEKYHPKTTQSYLMSLRHFYSFALTEQLDVDISKDEIVVLKEKISRWSSSYGKSCSKRHWQKMEEDQQLLITSVQIKEFERSQAARDAICLLGQLSGAHAINISQSQYTLLRDFLLVEITIDNANRAGALSNMKLAEFKNMRKQGDEFVISVKDHKTLATHGPARIVLSAKLYSWMQIFVAEVRSIICSSSDSKKCVFLSWTGEPLASSQINKALKSVWKKAEVDGTPSSTLFRKSAVTGVHSSSDSSEIRGNLADLMAHNTGTAQRYYKLHEKSLSSVQASKQLRKVMRGKIQEEDGYEDPKSTVTSTSQATSDECISTSPRISWSTDKEKMLKTLFKEEIEKKKISIVTVKSKISGNPLLGNESPKRVYDKVRAQWRYGKPGSPEHVELPSVEETLQQRIERSLGNEDNSSDIIPPTERSSVRNVFGETDLDNIRSLFSDMICNSMPISKVTIKRMLEKEDWGRVFLSKVSLDTVVNRVKYERRLKR